MGQAAEGSTAVEDIQQATWRTMRAPDMLLRSCMRCRVAGIASSELALQDTIDAVEE